MPSPPDPQAAVLLRPGVRVLRRDRETWQFVLGSSQPLLLGAGPQTDPLIESLASTPTVFGASVAERRLFRILADRDLLVDSASITRSVVTDPVTAQTLSAVIARHGDDAGAVLARRARVGVQVHGPANDRAALERILAPTGIEVTTGDGTRGVRVVVLIEVGELERSRLDDLVRAGRPHLVVRAIGGRAVVGPFVVPGRSACLRCLDAHHSEQDPMHPLLVQRCASGARADGVAEPVDPTQWALAVATAAHDVLRYADGRKPVTWSSTRSFTEEDEPTHTRWRRHPRCGCSWPDPLVPTDRG